MTTDQAIEEIRRVGSIRAENGKLKLRFRERDRERLGVAIEVLRRNRQAALDVLSGALASPLRRHLSERLSDQPAREGAAAGYQEATSHEVWLGLPDWKARALNRLFQEQGLTGRPGRITSETVRHGETCRQASKVDKNGNNTP